MTLEAPKPDWAMNRRELDDKDRSEKGLPRRKRRRWPWLVVIAAIGAGGFYANDTGRLDPLKDRIAEARAQQEAAVAEAEAELAKAVEGAMQLAEFEIYHVTSEILRETLRVTGSLAPVQQLQFTAEVSARVDEVNVRAGDAIKLGDVLVKLDVDNLREQLAQQRNTSESTGAQLSLAVAEMQRTISLVERDLSPASALERAKSDVRRLTSTLAAQETMVRSAELNLARATVTAPFDGVVSERKVDPGQFANVGSPLVSIVDLTDLEFTATAPVNDSPKIEVGQQVELRVEGFGDQVFQGRVERISPVTVDGTRMLPVYVGVPNPDGILLGGMFAYGELVLDVAEDAIGIPTAALREDENGPYVLAIANGIAERRVVTVAREWNRGRLVEISGGLAAGDIIVASPIPELRPGTPVELLEF